MVGRSSQATLSLPGAFAQANERIQLIAERIGSSNWYKSEPVAIRANSQIALNVAADLERSTVSVRG
jgi:hypothetical protein